RKMQVMQRKRCAPAWHLSHRDPQPGTSASMAADGRILRARDGLSEWLRRRGRCGIVAHSVPLIAAEHQITQMAGARKTPNGRAVSLVKARLCHRLMST